MNIAVVVMTRIPEPGKTKTRLMPDLSGEECASFHMACLQDIFNVVINIVTNRKMDGYVYITGDGEIDIPPELTIGYQSGNDLGQRLYNVAIQLLPIYNGIIFIGSDLPNLEPEVFINTHDLLDKFDVVIGPATDGGYYLIGMKRLYEEIFLNIEWGGPFVLAQTIAAIKRIGLSYYLLKTRSDIDTWDDLKRFCSSVRTSGQKELFSYGFAKGILLGKE